MNQVFYNAIKFPARLAATWSAPACRQAGQAGVRAPRLPKIPTKNEEPGTFFNGSPGFTLVELMIAVAIFALAVSGAIGVYVTCQQMWHRTSLGMLANRDVNSAMSRIVYGVGSNSGLRAAASVAISSNANGWSLTCSNKFDGAKTIVFNAQASNIYWLDSVSQSSRICDHVSSAVVSKNASGVNLQLEILRQDGRFTTTNRLSTFVLMRNRE